MQAIIFHQQKTAGGSWLPLIKHANGESNLARQQRLFASKGITSLILIASAEDLNAMELELRSFNFPGCTLSVLPLTEMGELSRKLKTLLSGENVIISDGSLLLDHQLLDAFLSQEHQRSLAIAQYASDASLHVQLSIKSIAKIGTGFSGISCRNLVPLCRLDAEGFRLVLDAIDGAEDFWDGINTILPTLQLLPYSVDQYFFGMLTGDASSDSPLLDRLSFRDANQQISFHEKGCIVRLKSMAKSLNIHKPLLIHDKYYHELPVDAVLTAQGITPVYFCMDEQPTKEQILLAVSLIQENGLDGLISVGNSYAIEGAKCIKLFTANGFTEEALNLPFFSGLPHIAVPNSVEYGTESTHYATFLREGGPYTISQPCILPDAVLIDGYPQSNEPIDDFAEKIAWTSAVSQQPYSTTQSSRLASESLNLLRTNQDAFLSGDAAAKNNVLWAINMAAHASVLIEQNRILPETNKIPSPENPSADQDSEQMNASPAAEGIKPTLYKTVKAFSKKKIAFSKNRLRFLKYGYKYNLDTQMVLFESAHGNAVNCNPRAIYNAMLQDKDYLGFTFVWAVKRPSEFAELKQNPRTVLVKQGSRAYIKKCAQAKYWVSNYNMPAYLLKGKDHVWIHTWHGKPIKRIGCDFNNKIRPGYDGRVIKRNYTKAAKQMTYLLSPAPIFSKHMASAYNLPALKKENIVVETGYPRNDFLFQHTQEDVIRIKLRLGIPLDKKVILYTPTWRVVNSAQNGGFVYESHLDVAALTEKLGDDYIFLFRTHPYEAAFVDFSKLGSRALNVCHYPQVNDLYIISDLMISDYSGTIFDYAVLKRPMIFYQYDRDEYVNEQTGIYFDLDQLPGPIVYEESKLADTIREHLANFVYDEKYQRFNKTFNGLDGEDCGRRTAHMLIPKVSDISKEKLRSDKIRDELRNYSVQFSGLFRGLGISQNPNTKNFAAYHNKFKGKRCFLIGNGPSLSLDDLHMIKDEYSFCCNLIYKIFDRTDWRPTFYCISDLVFTKTIADELAKNITVPFFTSAKSYAALKGVRPKESLFVNTVKNDIYYVHGNMKQYYVPANATVMTFMIELAMYMGFSEIYLLGVDCSNGFVQGGHFIEDYENDAMMQIEHKRAGRVIRNKHLTLEELGKWRTDRSMFAYSVLRKYADSHGYHIYNATRGGYLEEFERVKLEDVLKAPSEK